MTRAGDRWTADFVLNQDAPVWAFFRSALTMETRQSWRLAQWQVETPGLVMERRGAYDVIRTLDGSPVPRRVRVDMRPQETNLEADYPPSLVMSNGAVSFFTGHFDVLSVASVEAAAALPSDLNGVEVAGGHSRITWHDEGGEVLLNGERVARGVTTAGEQTYVLFGPATLETTERLATVIDPELPAWIGQELGVYAPLAADHYTQRLGPPSQGRPTVMISWKGPTPARRSMGGSVLPGLIVMSFEGVGVVERTPPVRDAARWFIGHESAHFWLGQTVRYEFSRDAWILEGGADMMAIRAAKAIDPNYDAQSELQDEIDDCIALVPAKAIVTAAERGEHRANYACGAVFAMVAEGAVIRRGGRDWFDYLRPLIDANRADGVLTRAEWLDELTRVSGDASLAADIGVMLDAGVADPAAMIASLFQRSGVAHRHETGKVTLL